MNQDNVQSLQLALEVLNVLVIPVLFGVGRWLMKVELRLARLEWGNGRREEDANGR